MCMHLPRPDPAIYPPLALGTAEPVETDLQQPVGKSPEESSSPGSAAV